MLHVCLHACVQGKQGTAGQDTWKWGGGVARGESQRWDTRVSSRSNWDMALATTGALHLARTWCSPGGNRDACYLGLETANMQVQYSGFTTRPDQNPIHPTRHLSRIVVAIIITLPLRLHTFALALAHMWCTGRCRWCRLAGHGRQCRLDP